jgi:phosphate transport system substrate-binding protein
MPLSEGRAVTPGARVRARPSQLARPTKEEHRVTITTPKRIGSLALTAALAIGACSSSGGATTAPSTGPESQAPATSESAPAESAAAAVSGSINVSGSSTVEPISTGVAEALQANNPDFQFTVKGPGTGDGFKTFCKGETDISDASRKIKDEEAAACQSAGIQYVELPIAYDGMTVMTNPANTSVTCLSFADLYALIGPESKGFTKWSDAQPLAKELGSNTVFPNADLAITGPGEESGTYDSFVEIALDKIADPRGQIDPETKHTATRPDYTASANDNTIIEGIAGSPSSLGWVGFAYAEENKDKVAEIQVAKDPNGTCVSPSADTIADASYPLSRTLYIYVNKAKAAENPAVSAFVDYYLADGTISTVLETVPYVNLPQDKLTESRSTWDSSK